MKKVIHDGNYDIIWTNEPVMGVTTRLAARKARKKGTKVIYMVHGFHFFKGAPKKNWLLYYPIERLAAHFCDEIVTINHEDYERAKKLAVPSVKYIHGIGVDTERLQKREKRRDIRKELGIKTNDFLLLSAGELNLNKNHQVIIRALAQLEDFSIHYIICGKGDQKEKLCRLAENLEIQSNVHFLGYRNDVVDICSQSDAFAFPSYREGLGLAALEAMYCGLPLITSNVRGPVDFMEDGVTGYMCNPDDVLAFANSIKKLKTNVELRKKMAENNKQMVLPFCLDNTLNEVIEIIWMI